MIREGGLARVNLDNVAAQLPVLDVGSDSQLLEAAVKGGGVLCSGGV